MSTDNTTPMIFDHCCSVYSAMKKTSTDVEGHTVWEGFLTRLICEDLGFATPYYTSIRKELRRMECIRQMRRGGSTTPSQWELLQAPSVDLFQHSPERRNDRQTIVDAQSQQITDLARRVDTLEKLFQQGIKIVKEAS